MKWTFSKVIIVSCKFLIILIKSRWHFSTLSKYGLRYLIGEKILKVGKSFFHCYLLHFLILHLTQLCLLFPRNFFFFCPSSWYEKGVSLYKVPNSSKSHDHLSKGTYKNVNIKAMYPVRAGIPKSFSLLLIKSEC